MIPWGPFVLFVCAGPLWEGNVEAAAASMGVPVLAVDPLRGGDGHNITRSAVLEALRGLCARPVHADVPCVVAAHMAPPCRSFSHLNRWRGLRTRCEPESAVAPVDYSEYIARDDHFSGGGSLLWQRAGRSPLRTRLTKLFEENRGTGRRWKTWRHCG